MNYRTKSILKMLRTKSFWTGVGVVVTGVCEAMGIDVPDGLLEGLMGLGLIFLRAGIAKKR